jgi:hypothetical protein
MGSSKSRNRIGIVEQAAGDAGIVDEFLEADRPAGDRP